MMIVCVLLASCFTALMFYKMVLPLFAPMNASSLELLDDDLKELEELVNLKMLAMSNLNELELDLELEKITQEDYVQLKRRSQRQIIGIIKKLDGIHGGRGWEDKIEQELLRRRAQSVASAEAPAPSLPAEPSAAHTIERLDEDLVKPPEDAAPLLEQECPECGNNVRAGAKFCDECGHSMPAPAAIETGDETTALPEKEHAAPLPEQECPECGNSVRGDAKLCDECSHPMPAPVTIEPPRAQEINQ